MADCHQDFSLQTLFGNDTTQEVLQKAAIQFLFLQRKWPDTKSVMNKEFGAIFTAKKNEKYPLYFITANAEQVVAYLGRNGIPCTISRFKVRRNSN